MQIIRIENQICSHICVFWTNSLTRDNVLIGGFSGDGPVMVPFFQGNLQHFESIKRNNPANRQGCRF